MDNSGVWVRRIQAVVLLHAVFALMVLGLGILYVLMHSVGATSALPGGNSVGSADYVFELVTALGAVILGLVAVAKMLTPAGKNMDGN